MSVRRFAFWIALVAALTAQRGASACATCYGAEGHPQTEGLNMAIVTLLITTYALAGLMFGVGFYLWRRGVRAAGGETDSALRAGEAVPNG